jgi:hypothetical protein
MTHIQAGAASNAHRYSFLSCLRRRLLGRSQFSCRLAPASDVSPIDISPQHFTRHHTFGHALNQRAFVGWQLPQSITPKAHSLRRDAQRFSQIADGPAPVDGGLNGVEIRINLIHGQNSTLVVDKNLQPCFVFFLHLFILSTTWQ